MAPRLDRSKWVAKTQAKTLFCLKDSELEGLQCEERPNPRARRGPPMKLFQKEQLERAAIAKWGSLAALEAERERRQQLREQRSIASFFRQQQEGQPQEGGEQLWAEEHCAWGQQQEQQGTPGVGQDGEQQVDSTNCNGLQARAQRGQQGWQAAPAARQSPHGLPWLQSLPPPLLERVCVVPRQAQRAQQAQQAQQAGGSYVLYWMKTAVRGHENPALDVAAAAAAALGLPLLAASFLLASHPFASARRWRFLLEGLRDAQAELRGQGIELLVYLEGLKDAGPAAEGRGCAAASGGASSAIAGAAEGGAAGPASRAAADPYSPSFSFHPAPGYQQTAGWQALQRLASGAALVVTEDMPVPPDTDWLLALAEQLSAEVPVTAVDTACLLPMRLVKKCHEKAYSFRSATEAQRRQRIARVYQLAPGTPPVGPAALALPPAALAGLPALPPELLSREGLGWEPLDLASMPPPQLAQQLDALLARCAGIDHSVPSVAHMPGGSAAGYVRWEAFRKKGLSIYAARRNDPMLREGTSRLSAYHHWGMVSPFKVAREAILDRSAGAAKFLDEFLIWREIGFNLCLHRHALLHSLAALPQWARETLERHAGDPRPAALPYPRLEAGQTGDAWWDAAQRQLVKTGELHNWSRMTWGKAFLGWAPSPQAALSAALHANHRWALDGCDPASYAGVLWCFGMYDAPKASAETPVSGCLAGKSTAAAARRLPPAAYAALPP